MRPSRHHLVRLGWLASASIALASCGSTPAADLRSAGVDTPSTTGSPTTTDTPTSTAPVSTTDTTASTTTVPPEPVTTTSTIVGPTTSGVGSGDWAGVETIVEFGADGERFVRLTSTPPDPDDECPSGQLGLEVGGEITHVYEEVGAVSGLTGELGPYGQIAIVENCEEWTSRILFASVAVPPPDGVPILVQAVPPDEVFHLHSFGWWALTGLFAADAAFYDGEVGWNDTVVFDGFDGSMRLAADAAGWREPVLDVGVDYVAPSSWLVPPFDPAATSVAMNDDESDSWVLVTVHEPGTEPRISALDGEQPQDEPDRYDVHLWETVDAQLQRARVAGSAAATEYTFFGADGARRVRRVELDDRVVDVEAFVAAGTGAPFMDIPFLTLDAVRVYESVG